MWKCGTALCAALLCAGPVSAQVVKLEISSREVMSAGAPAGAAGPFELIRGRIHGEVDPKDPHNAIIQDLGLAPPNARGKVEYVATFALAKPVDLAKASRVLLYQVVNRGNGQAAANPEGDITLVSGWQGDVMPTATNQTIVVPVARKKDGSPVTGRVIARFFDLPDGAPGAPIRLASLGTPQPYPPADLAWGWIPFAKTKAERIASRDPRPSLEERYGTHDGYVAIVRKAAEQAVNDRFLLPDDAARILRAAEASTVLQPSQPAVSAAPACEQLTSFNLTNAAVTVARAYPAGDFTTGRTFQVPAFCRVAVTAKPTVDSDIKVEVWVPSAWNGKLLGTDNGGFSGAINYGALANAIAKGYAAVSTDTGHTGDQMDFGIGHPEKIADWAHRAVHEMTVIAKAVVERAGGRAPLRSYFSGCSTGGQQALSEAQRYPADYDGIIAGAPGNNRINLIYGFLWSWLATHDAGGKATLPAAKLPALARAAVAACDKQDGLEDGVIDDPRACRFDPAALACTAAESDSCLTAPQIEAVAKVYAGARARDGRQLYPGWAHGSESGWGQYITNPGVPVRIALFRDWVFENPKWDPRTFDWDKDVAAVDAAWPMLNAISTDYTAFNARGGKLIMYTGLADPVVSPLDTIEYYERVVSANGGLDATRRFYRFFPVPGMAHCGGGSGTSTFDALAALEAWVERGTAPDSIPASRSINGRVDRTRPLCAYPVVARYRGSGSIDDAANFACTPAR